MERKFNQLVLAFVCMSSHLELKHGKRLDYLNDVNS